MNLLNLLLLNLLTFARFYKAKIYNYLCLKRLQGTSLFCEQIEQKQIEQIAFFYVSMRFQIISIIYIIINNIFIYIYY